MASKLDNLEIEDVSALTTDTADGFIQSLEDLDATEKDLKALKSAEKSGKNRNKIIQHIDSKINSLKVAEDIGVAQEDVEEIENLLEDITDIKNTESTEDKLENIERDKLLELVGGTVKEIKDFVRDNEPSIAVLELLLESEKKVKDRKTAVEFISKELKNQKLSKDVENTRRDLETLKEDLEVVEEDADTEDTVEDPEEDYQGEESSEENSNEEKDNEDEAEEKIRGEELEKKEDEENSSYKEESNEEKDDEELSEIEKKKQILKSIEADIDDDELENVSIEELKRIKEDKSEREEIISELEDQGFDREKLQKASTHDLRTVLDEATEDSEEVDNSEEEDQKSEEEIREEAEEDLQMLMGAVRDGAEEEEEASDRLTDLRETIANKFGSEEEEEEEANQEMNDKDVKDVLEKYKELESTEASIKTAHIMKGYLESELGIKRELTYKELAEELPKDTEDMNELAEFFKTMHKDEYMQNIDTASDEVIGLCERVVDKF